MAIHATATLKVSSVATPVVQTATQDSKYSNDGSRNEVRKRGTSRRQGRDQHPQDRSLQGQKHNLLQQIQAMLSDCLTSYVNISMNKMNEAAERTVVNGVWQSEVYTAEPRYLSLPLVRLRMLLLKGINCRH